LLGISGVVAFYGALVRHALTQKNYDLLALLAGAVLAAMLSMYVARHDPGHLVRCGGRHFYIPAVVLVWAIVLSAPARRHWKWLPLGAMLAAFVLLNPSTKWETRRDLDWAGHVARCVGTQPYYKIPINPVWEATPNWFAVMHSHVFTPPPLQTAFVSRFGEHLDLLGYDVVQDRSALNLRLVWRRAAGKIDKDYRCCVAVSAAHDPAQVLVRLDRLPLGGKYPTSKWLHQEVVSDWLNLDCAGLAPGEYRIAVGWYDPNGPETPALVALDEQGQAWNDRRAVLPLAVSVGRQPDRVAILAAPSRRPNVGLR